ncbi:MAG: hypothetical protein ACYS15_14885 [Planctomycetota bacterium]|jgi:hypothetical protein
MTPSKALLGSLLLLLASPPPLQAAQPTPQERLGGQFGHAAAATLALVDPVTTPALFLRSLEISILLATEAAYLDPSPDRWRMLLRLADVAEQTDLRSEALAQLVALDPYDEVARLLYVNDVIERYQTAEQRIAVYEKFLAPKNRPMLGPAVTSRLANDLALLLDRCGDVDGFSEWLAEAVAVDPSNRSAAATAAGFFRANVADPYGEAELLTTLVMADPTAPGALVVLAELMLEHGAYAASDRLYQLSVRSQDSLRQFPSEGLLADWAVARWGNGDPQGALEIIQLHQRRVDEVYRTRLWQENRELTPLDLAKRHGPISSTLSTVRAAIRNRLADEQAAPTLEAALAAYEMEIDQARQAEGSRPSDVAQRHLEAASVALWLGGDIAAAQGHLHAAGELLGDDGLTREAEARFEGWIALRQHDLARAMDVLQPVSDRDAAARLGLALARREGGELPEAARGLHAVYSSRPGSLMAVWASDVLAEMLGQRVGPGPTAARMEQLAASIPSVVDRFPDEPTLAVSVRLVPTKTTYEPYEPIIINLEITNNAPMPLAIDSGGPIPPQVAIFTSVQMSRVLDPPDISPLIVDIDRRLRLEPRERLVVPVDMRRSGLGRVLRTRPLQGATVKIKAIIGFRMTGENVFGPGVLGSEVQTPPVRIDGVRLSRGWIANAIEAIVEPDSEQDLTTIAILSHVVARMQQVRDADPLRALELFGDRQLDDAAAVAIVEAYPKLDADSRAWLLAAMPRGAPSLAPVYTMAQTDQDKRVQMMYLLYCLTGLDDPMIDAARRGSDTDVAAVAEMMHDRLSARAAP